MREWVVNREIITNVPITPKVDDIQVLPVLTMLFQFSPQN